MKKTLSDAENIILRGLPKAIAALEKKLKTKRGPTLEEKLALDELRFMMASGFGDPRGGCYEGAINDNNNTLLTEIKKNLKDRSKSELIHDLAIAILRIKDLEIYSKFEKSRFHFLLDHFDGRVEKRVTDSKNRTVKRSAGKAAIHKKRFEQAEILYIDMLNEFPNFDVTHAREFYHRLDKVCVENGLGSLGINTRRNYFKKLTGLESTK